MKKFYKFHQDLYYQEFVFIPNWTEAEIYNYFDEPLKPAAGAVFTKNGVIIIWVKEFTLDNLEFLTHESVHAANTLFHLRGQEISVKNDEAQAYLVQWVFGRCLALAKRKLK